MKVELLELIVRTRRSSERIVFSPTATFIHGPVGTGKSTVARLIDFCFGGHLEKTPAVQQEFLSATLGVRLGEFSCQFERALSDDSSVRVTWASGTDIESLNAPLAAASVKLLDADVFNLSDLIFHLCGVAPIKVRQSQRDPDSPLRRLSFRDLLWYCYLDQDNLDSSFFRLEDPMRGAKSRDAMRFFTGLHSDRLNELGLAYDEALQEQRTKREAVKQIRAFMDRFQLSSGLDIAGQIEGVKSSLNEAVGRRDELDRTRSAQTHVVDPLRAKLRELAAEMASVESAVTDTDELIAEQVSLRSELMMAKIKSVRIEQAGQVLQGVSFSRCPECGNDVSSRSTSERVCRLCGEARVRESETPSVELEALRRDMNERIDELADSISRRRDTHDRQQRSLSDLQKRKAELDRQLTDELRRYDSAFVTSIRAADRDVATFQERLAALERLRELPEAIGRLEEEAGELQGRIDRLRSAIEEERGRLTGAHRHAKKIGDRFLEIMLKVGFPGVYENDHVVLDPRNWRPMVVHHAQEWGFFDAGSGGKKTLFNVCYALAIHAVATEIGLPVPSFLILDSPTKNISEDVDPQLVRALYDEIYALAGQPDQGIQFLLIDSDLVSPRDELRGFSHRRLAGTAEDPSLIPYYIGP